jgi:hypothetical protein
MKTLLPALFMTFLSTAMTSEVLANEIVTRRINNLTPDLIQVCYADSSGVSGWMTIKPGTSKSLKTRKGDYYILATRRGRVLKPNRSAGTRVFPVMTKPFNLQRRGADAWKVVVQGQDKGVFASRYLGQMGFKSTVFHKELRTTMNLNFR